MPTLLEGKTLASEIRANLQERVAKLRMEAGREPQLAAISCSENEAADRYLRKEIEACQKIGISCRTYPVDSKTHPGDFASLLKNISGSQLSDAVLVPRPLPKQLEHTPVCDLITPEKDIDGASTYNMGRLFLCKDFKEIAETGIFVPCTALAVIRLLRHHQITLSGARVAVIGRSATVGRPLAHLFSCLDATVTLCHSRTNDLPQALKDCDIVVSAIGKPRWLTPAIAPDNAVIVDVGTNTDDKGVFCGDADFEALAPRSAAITPVPGGVGPVTLACLLENIVTAAEANFKR